jgi:hypothetical protein
MWQRFVESKHRLSQRRGESFSPPVFAIMTEEGMKIIQKRDGSLEVYDLRESLVESDDLAPNLPRDVLNEYGHLLETLKFETGFHEAADAMLTRADG